MKGVQSKRLGKAYDFQNHMSRCYVSEDIVSSVEKEAEKLEKIEAIVVHVGVNDLKRKSPEEASLDFVQNIKKIREKHPESEIIISKIAPLSDEEKNNNRELYNAFAKSALRGTSKVSFVDHENLNPQPRQHLASDGIHPNEYGTRLLAANIGRHVKDVLWEKKKSKSANHKARGNGYPQQRRDPRRDIQQNHRPPHKFSRRSLSPHTPHYPIRRPRQRRYHNDYYYDEYTYNDFEILSDYYD